ncbi:CobW family GTP-binding protein [Cupriavidus plantarum]|uniref:G3E family GTPase n=1 Tax=Cupriavidus plantarum TaxID=942865 RepID=A0A316EU14_9BURK|nr:GTP-binding protein [Cupriavidus plantarum]PWK34237.1 G3E family GTPase [Cupriavidus plantarum]
MRIEKIPATVVTGFLGTGKTTLVNHVLGHIGAERVGVIVNEFGEVGIDGGLIVANEQAVVEINNGCVCCTVRGDLVAGVETLLNRPGWTPQRLIVETSGLADPAPVLQTFLADPTLRDRFMLESVIAVVDARHFAEQIRDDIAREQVVFADRIVINKADLADQPALAALEREIRALNPTAAIERACQADVPVTRLIGQRGFSLDNLLAIEPDLLDDHAHDHEHDASIASCAFVIPGSLDPTRFQRWANELVQAQGAQLMRTKGILNIRGEARRLHFHSVHMLMDTAFGKPWQADAPRETRFVAIGRQLDPDALRAGLLACAA